MTSTLTKPKTPFLFDENLHVHPDQRIKDNVNKEGNKVVHSNSVPGSVDRHLAAIDFNKGERCENAKVSQAVTGFPVCQLYF